MTNDELLRQLYALPVRLLHRLAKGRIPRYFRMGKHRIIQTLLDLPPNQRTKLTVEVEGLTQEAAQPRNQTVPWRTGLHYGRQNHARNHVEKLRHVVAVPLLPRAPSARRQSVASPRARTGLMRVGQVEDVRDCWSAPPSKTRLHGGYRAEHRTGSPTPPICEADSAEPHSCPRAERTCRWRLGTP